ncbi:DMT family transporter [Variovorax sp. OV329]|uniref:DMT family transporter n=1 Tax=Variovorax sp. OV329 TaxID=1882825 RepID=UPI0008E8F346|nr:DMT family transporter [Variovorax sp. OV329]SFL91363.1 Permease of the drug/metabolite transporter (DMT) superfamily [Variovorax sp. OV329]
MSEGECAQAPVTSVPAASTEKKKTPGWALDLVLLGALWGASFLFMRIGAAEFGAVPTAGVRVGIAALVLLPLMWLRGQAGDFARHWKAAMLVGVSNSGLPFALFAFALLSINSGLAAVLNATVPMFGALVAWAWFRERPDNSRLVGLGIGFVGVALLAGHSAGFKSGSGISPVWAVLACLGACLSYGVSASATRRYLTGVPAFATAAGSQLGASLALLLPTWYFWPAQMPSTRAWLALLAVGVACTGLAYVLFFRLIATAGPQRALTVTFLVPVFAVFYGAIFLDEEITTWMLMCALVIVCGVALSTGLVKLGRKKAAVPAP